MIAVVFRPLVGPDLPVMVQVPPWAIKSVVATVEGTVPGHRGRIRGVTTSGSRAIMDAAGLRSQVIVAAVRGLRGEEGGGRDYVADM